MTPDVSLRFVRLPEKKKVGDLLVVDGKLHRIVRGPTGSRSPWTHLATAASDEEQAVWDVMAS